MSQSRRRNWQQQRRVELTVELARSVHSALEQTRSGGARRRAWWMAIQAATGTAGGPDECRSLLAQTFAATTSVMLATDGTLLQPSVRRWLLATASPLWQDVVNDSVFLLTGEGEPVELSVVRSHRVRDGLARLGDALANPQEIRPDSPDDSGCTRLPFDFFEEFLAVYDAGCRRSRGIFFTPRPLARWIVARLDQLIRSEFGIPRGLADPVTWSQLAARHPGWVIPREVSPDEPFLQLLEPSLGTGVFLDEVIDVVHRQFCAEAASGGPDPAGGNWDDYVQGLLLPRLAGLEIMLPACVVAHLRLADRLARTGFSFQQSMPIGIHLADTLAGPATGQPLIAAVPRGRYRQAVAWGRQVALARHATVVLGNPPFSGISQADGRWITGLLRGIQRRSPPAADYYQSEGQPLGERKVWLQDDYVKFLRFAHWKIEQAGCGLIGLITNHGYLDNPTFRGVRYQLMQTFPRIDVIDLHGNRKKKEICPDGAKDASVFGVDQGIAIGLFRRRPGDRNAGVRHRDLWGAAEDKLDTLQHETGHLLGDLRGKSDHAAGPASGGTNLVPQSPYFFFVPRDESRADEYCRAPRLVDIFPIHVTAPVTARDHFVVALERGELIERLTEFRDLSIPDDTIRRRFTNTRSRKYPPGDTRGWNLSEARRRFAADDRWQQRIRTCWYRPFDRRYVIWSSGMIDWPRDEVTGHLLAGPNLALIARRQMLPSRPCNYFWISDDLVLDGVIRSDNRGSESLFPLYLYVTDGDAPTQRRVNLDPRFLQELADALDWIPVAQAAGDLNGTFGAEDVLHYIYALFHSDGYRTRYADLLRRDFPRVLLPRQAGLFAQLSRYGRYLVEAHLLRVPTKQGTQQEAGVSTDDWTIAPGYPKYAKGRVSIHQQQVLAKVPRRVWDFHVGGHQVCQKWLKERRSRSLRPDERHTYRQMVAAIEQTLDWSQRIDQAIVAHGGWPDAFTNSRRQEIVARHSSESGPTTRPHGNRMG